MTAPDSPITMDWHGVVTRWRAAEAASPALSFQVHERGTATRAGQPEVVFRDRSCQLDVSAGAGSIDYRLATSTGKVPTSRPAVEQRGDARWVIGEGLVTAYGRSNRGVLTVSFEQTVPSAEANEGSPAGNLMAMALGRNVVDPIALPQPGVVQRKMMSVPEFLEESVRAGGRIEVLKAEGERVRLRVDGYFPTRTDEVTLDLAVPPLLVRHERRYDNPSTGYRSVEVFEVTEIQSHADVRLPAIARLTQSNSKVSGQSVVTSKAVPTEIAAEKFDTSVMMNDVSRMMVFDGVRHVAYIVERPGRADQTVQATHAVLSGGARVDYSSPEAVADSIAARSPIPGFYHSGPVKAQAYVQTTAGATAPPPVPGGKDREMATSLPWLAAALLAVALLVHFTRKPKGVSP